MAAGKDYLKDTLACMKALIKDIARASEKEDWASAKVSLIDLQHEAEALSEIISVYAKQRS